MKISNIKNIILDKVASLNFIPELISSKGHLYISFAIPRFKKNNYNWGDDINIVFGELLSGKKVIPYRYSLIKHTNYLIIGSVIQWYLNSNSIVWGAGLIGEVSKLPKPKKVLAVRGPLTRQELIKCGIECPEVYGDPALLIPKFYSPKISLKYKIGIICHYSELNSISFEIPINMEEKDILFIDISNYGHWSHFIDQVLSCEAILSSSLHGLIISEAYQIPNLWTNFGLHLREKKSFFKYKDFYLSIGKNNSEPFDYSKLLNKQDLLGFILKNWSGTTINVEKLVDSCPFDFDEALSKLDRC